jgi:hypothetical protein
MAMNVQNGTPSERPHVAVLGTGIMGAGMAERLLDEGFPVDVWPAFDSCKDRLGILRLVFEFTRAPRLGQRCLFS